jgi:hypothetical protein
MEENNDFFLQPIQEMPFSEEFKFTAASHRLHTLHDLLEVEAADLLRKPGVTYHFLQEFVQYLEENGQAHLLKE